MPPAGAPAPRAPVRRSIGPRAPRPDEAGAKVTTARRERGKVVMADVNIRPPKAAGTGSTYCWVEGGGPPRPPWCRTRRLEAAGFSFCSASAPRSSCSPSPHRLVQLVLRRVTLDHLLPEQRRVGPPGEAPSICPDRLRLGVDGCAVALMVEAPRPTPPSARRSTDAAAIRARRPARRSSLRHRRAPAVATTPAVHRRDPQSPHVVLLFDTVTGAPRCRSNGRAVFKREAGLAVEGHLVHPRRAKHCVRPAGHVGY